MDFYDLIIVGGGCAGLSAGMYAGRLEMKTLLLARDIGGTITKTDTVENYPGFKKLTGQELIDRLKEHALEYKRFLTMKEESVEKIETSGECRGFKVKTEDSEYKAKAVLLATGTGWRELDAKNAKDFENRGISYCALCDGPMFKDKTVAVVGGSDSAAKEALVLSRYAKKVFIIYRGDEIHPEPVTLERIKQEKKIEVVSKTNVVEVKGDRFVNSVVLDNPYKGSKELKLEGVFVSIGHIPLNDLAKPLKVKLNEKGEIIINRESETSVPGVFAAGDVCDTRFKQAITGVGEAVSAVYSAHKYISENEIVCK